MPISDTEALTRVIEHREIFHDEMLALMRRIMSGEMSPVMIAAIAIGLRVKKETIGEITAAATVMREFAVPVPVLDRTNLVDIVGTGGDSSHTFNISTASVFVAAAAGARVAKHGGRSVSSTSGSADVVEALGAHIILLPELVATCLQETGIGFMFAPNHHASMKYAAPVRKELGVRTLFNILGPLTNPAGAPNQLMGVFHPDLVGIQVRVLRVVNQQESVACIRRALSNEDGPIRDIVLLNAGAALYCAGVAGSVAEGVRRAREAVASGAAQAKLEQFVTVTRKLKPNV